MDFKELVVRTRSVRRFDASRKIPCETLVSLVDSARLAPSGSNKQTKKYIVITCEDLLDKVFPMLKWAGYLTDWDGPEREERPVGYIVILQDKSLSQSNDVDTGIVAESIVLQAASSGIGACMLASVDRKALMDLLDIDPDCFYINLVIALGYPAEFPVLEDVVDGDIKYYRDEKGVHHVPKRVLGDVLLKTL